MKDASHALNSGLAFSSSSRKCQVFKMIYCHAVRWGDGQRGNGLREGCAGLQQGTWSLVVASRGTVGKPRGCSGLWSLHPKTEVRQRCF